MWNRHNKNVFKLAFSFSVVILLISFTIEPAADIIITNLLSVSVIKAAVDVTDLDLCKQHVEPTSEIQVDGTRARDNRNLSIAAGMEAWLAGDCETAAKIWHDYSQDNDYHIAGHYWNLMAESNLHQLDSNEHDELPEEFERIVGLKVRRSFAQGDKQLANVWFPVAAFHYPEIGSETMYPVAWDYYKAGKGAEAADFLTIFANSLPPNSLRRVISLGLIERLRGDIIQAIKYYEQALTFDDFNREILSLLRNAYLDSGDVKRGLSIAIREAEIAPNDNQSQGEALLNIARIYKQLEEFETAEAWAQAAFNINPEWWPILVELGEIYCLSGSTDNALQFYDHAESLAKNSPWLISILGSRAECHYVNGELSEAILIANNVIETYQDNNNLISLYLKLGQWYSETGTVRQAIKIYQSGLDRWPEVDSFEIRLSELIAD